MSPMAVVRPEIEGLIAEFAWRIDHANGEGVEELFTPDGVYAFNDWAAEGREQIADFYEQRRARAQRTSRHVYTNLRLRTASEERAAGTCVLTLHAADGPPPLPLSPLMVADYDDLYARGDDGVWRFARRSARLLFGDVPRLIRTRH